MWKVFSHDIENGKLVTLAEGETPEAAQNALLGDDDESENNTFVLYDGEVSSKEHEAEILDQLFSNNGEELTRISVGVKLSIEKNEIKSSCSGKCFCVVQRGYRQCETFYCFANGFCYWVRCGQSC